MADTSIWHLVLQAGSNRATHRGKRVNSRNALGNEMTIMKFIPRSLVVLYLPLGVRLCGGWKKITHFTYDHSPEEREDKIDGIIAF